mmetsp:Transcript_3382/g.11403  ORF Transcript_3382/g.11403 Transcript_3382/m.11403 type:complete len:239 (+) Transcript_3382:449-1165(+)
MTPMDISIRPRLKLKGISSQQTPCMILRKLAPCTSEFMTRQELTPLSNSLQLQTLCLGILAGMYLDQSDPHHLTSRSRCLPMTAPGVELVLRALARALKAILVVCLFLVGPLLTKAHMVGKVQGGTAMSCWIPRVRFLTFTQLSTCGNLRLKLPRLLTRMITSFEFFVGMVRKGHLRQIMPSLTATATSRAEQKAGYWTRWRLTKQRGRWCTRQHQRTLLQSLGLEFLRFKVVLLYLL